MNSEQYFYEYLKNSIDFRSKEAMKYRTIYAPLCGVDATKIKSSITPYLSGDIKTDKNHYLTKPVSCEDLRGSLRNFYFYVQGKGVFSFFDESTSKVDCIEMGPLWHKAVKRFDDIGLEVQALNFIPVSGENVEIMSFTVTNLSHQTLSFTPTLSIPIFARALENKHDHEHVTSLLHRIEQVPSGVVVCPSMFFNEEGHKENQYQYFVVGSDGQGQYPRGSFPTTDSFYGETGTVNTPEAVYTNCLPSDLSSKQRQGKEAVGALRFLDAKLRSRESKTFYAVVGMCEKNLDVERVLLKFNSEQVFQKALQENKDFWAQKINSLDFKTADQNKNNWLKWVTLQPILRRIFGCSFLPDHDYGKGGKGWRDIWQDLLSLILIEPETVREILLCNFAGVRIDGSNATIIGEKPGEFIADRNAISRVWMDHGVWPFMTVLLYIHQTGDFDILNQEQTYFRDLQIARASKKDETWVSGKDNVLVDGLEKVYNGSILEHILVQNLVQFFNVGDHNIIRLENADWNDGLDMAVLKGESVAFMSAYSGNLNAIADLLEEFKKESKSPTIDIAEELLILLEKNGKEPCSYDNAQQKRTLLYEKYFPKVQPKISGNKCSIHIEDLVKDFRKKAIWIAQHVCSQEKVNVQGNLWFNGYYDNKGDAVEGDAQGHVRMTLTGQVFPIMSGVAKKEDVVEVVKSVKRYLKDADLGGYRLNTDFKVDHYLDLGRAFGFAFGTKENGAFFSHMAVMYGYALLKRGFAKDGHDVLESIYKMSTDGKRSKIYPGIPEYFDSEGRGRYHYLTGSASWFILTVLTQVFGVRGQYGDLVLDPKLMKNHFSDEHKASVSCQFASKRLNVEYVNNSGVDYGGYIVKEICLNDEKIEFESLNSSAAKIKRDLIADVSSEINLRVVLD